MLEVTPAEILAMIIAEVIEVKDLHNLCRVSRRLYDAAMPFLYETIDITTPDTALEQVGHGFIHKASRPHLKLTKYLHVSAPLRKNLVERCGHFTVDDTGSDSDMRENETEEIGEHLLPILEHFSDDQLRGLSWNLGTCVPIALFGHKGFFSERQTRIETLSLITDCNCRYYAGEDKIAIDLSNFSNIRAFSWTGISSSHDFGVLQRCLSRNASHLRSLTLDLINWKEADEWWHEDHAQWHQGHSSNFLARDIFKLEEGNVETVFPSLDTLCLSNVSFGGAVNDIAHGLNIGNLRKLKLWDCPYSIQLLNYIVQYNRSPALTSLEFVMSYGYWDYQDYDDLEDLVPFFEAFQGLEDVYVLSPASSGSEKLIKAVLNHATTLTRIVLHYRDNDIDEDSRRFEEHIDWSLDWSPALESFLMLPKLECIGLCIELPLLKEQLSYLQKKPSCKLLHIRASGLSELQHGVWIEEFEDLLESDRDDEIEPLQEDEDEDTNDLEEVQTDDEDMDTSEYSSDEDEEMDNATRTQLESDESTYWSLMSAPKNLLIFAHWAFGPKGLLNLQFLVYGDFCHKGRYEKHNVILCRNVDFAMDKNMPRSDPAWPDLTFRIMRKGDEGLSDFYRLNGDFLEACAAEDFMKKL